MKRYLLKCEPLSPIHIGSGEELQAYEYVILDRLYKLNLDRFLDSLSKDEQEKVLDFIERNIIAFRDFVRERYKGGIEAEVTDYSVPIKPDVKKLYESKIDDPQNVLAVKLFQRTGSRPFVPGSSIKGAIRTAVLFSFYSSKKSSLEALNKRAFKSNFWEGKLLNYSNPQADPFKAVKFSDSIGEVKTVIVNARVHTFRKGRWEVDRYQILIEAVVDTPFEAELRIDEELQKEILKRNSDFIKISHDTIVESCRSFYSTHFKEESKRLAHSPVGNFYKTFQQKVESRVSDDHTLSFPLRLGWGSGFDAVTLGHAHNFESIISKVNSRLANPKKSAKLVQDMFPLGWLKVTLQER